MNAIKALALAQAKGGRLEVEALSVSQNGVYTADEGKAYSPVTVDVPTETDVPENDVVFLDYDGSIVAAYSASDFASLTAMPDNPTHEGLTAQGWNWTLSRAKAYVAGHGGLFIGQSYITSDGKTRIYIRLDEGRLSPYLGLAINGTVSVDWGDGSAADTVTGTSLSSSTNVRHNYAAAGDYVISVGVVTGSMAIVGDSSGTRLLWKGENVYPYQNHVYFNAIRKIEIGANCELHANSLQNCHSIEAITIPTSMGDFANYLFQNCENLRFVTIPYGMTSINKYIFCNCYGMKCISMSETIDTINEYVFRYCYGIRTIAIPNGVTALGQYAFNGMSALAKVMMPDSLATISNYAFATDCSVSRMTIPANVSQIGNSAFQDCSGLKELHFKPASPPTVNNANAFSGLPTDCVIYVPTGKLADYTSAQNYPSSATYTYAEE